jgi:DNA polymerase III delta prime subunit
MLSGPTGTGKTTLARIIKSELKCADVDFHEINAAADRGIETIRDVRQHVNHSPIGGPCKVWYFDEAHQLVKKQGGDAQTAMLKMLEDTPSHVYFILATSEPQHLLPTIRGRCTEIKLRQLSEEALAALVRKIADLEKVKIGKEAVATIAECAGGSARKALTLFDAVRHLPDAERADAVSRSDVAAQARDLCRRLMDPKAHWSNVVRVLDSLDDDPEAVRRAVLGYAAACLLKGVKPDRCYLILVAFEGDFFQSGRAGLVRACYEVYKDKD